MREVKKQREKMQTISILRIGVKNKADGRVKRVLYFLMWRLLIEMIQGK